MIKLKNKYGKIVYVNPDNITQITQDSGHENGKQMYTIVFDKHNETWIDQEQLDKLL